MLVESEDFSSLKIFGSPAEAICLLFFGKQIIRRPESEDAKWKMVGHKRIGDETAETTAEKTMPKRQLDNENSLKHFLMDIVRSKTHILNLFCLEKIAGSEIKYLRRKMKFHVFSRRKSGIRNESWSK